MWEGTLKEGGPTEGRRRKAAGSKGIASSQGGE